MRDPVRHDRSTSGGRDDSETVLGPRSVAGLDPARWLWIATITVVVGDLLTTLYGLEIGLSERNPVVVAVIGEFGIVGLVALKVVAVGWVVAIWRRLGRTYGLAALLGLFLPQAAAVVLNVATILGT